MAGKVISQEIIVMVGGHKADTDNGLNRAMNLYRL